MMTTFLTIILTALTTAIPATRRQDIPAPRLSQYEYIVSDTAKYENFRLKVLNDSDSLVYIESAQPSCGCILVTVQRTLAVRDRPGDIYIAVTSSKMSKTQPYTVDVYTNRNRTSPLRLVIRWPQPGEVPTSQATAPRQNPTISDPPPVPVNPPAPPPASPPIKPRKHPK